MKKEVKVNKIKKIVEKDVFEATCPKCGKIIEGSTENQVVFNMGLHQSGKSCFEQRVQNVLPQRDPNYVSQKDNKTTEVEDE